MAAKTSRTFKKGNTVQRTWIISLSILLLSLTVVSHAGQPASDPFLGDWQGDGLVAQVIPRGGGNYRVNFLPKSPIFAQGIDTYR